MEKLKAMRLQSATIEKRASPDSRHVEEELQQQAHKLAELVKELDCLSGISNLIETPDISIEGILRGTVELLPPAWQYPSLACARIILQDQTYKTANFQESAWRLASDIKVQGELTGMVEVFYLQEPPLNSIELFLSEEVKLLDVVAERLGRVIERKQAEEALLKRELTIRNIAEQVVDVIFATDDSGFITFVSPSALQMFGWKPEEMVGRSFIEFLPESEIPGAMAQFKDALASGQKTQNLSCVMKRKDESTFPGEVNSSVIWKEGRTAGTVGIIRDITERKRAEEALKESEERYRNQIEAINDVAYSINSGGKFTYLSPIVKNVLGYEPDEVTGRHFLEFVHQEDHDLLKRKFSELREGVVSHDEYRVIGKSGDVKWMRSQTSPILDVGGFAGGRGVIIDMTERRQAEEALRRAEENFHRSLDESPLGVRIVTIEGETIYANRAILNIYGYGSIEELKATPVKKRYTPESYAGFLIRAEKRRQGIDTTSEYTVGIIRKNGEVRHLQAFRKEILWDGERQFQTIYNDITERKRAVEEIRELLLMLESVPNGIVVHDADGNFLYANQRAFDIHGYSRDEFMVLNLHRITVPASEQLIAARIQELFDRGEISFEVEHLKKDGTILPLWVNVRKATWDNKGVFLSVQTDITERKRAAEALAAESHQLQETNTALRVLLQHVKDDQQKIERRITANIRKLILPNLEKLRGLKLNDLQANCMEIVAANLQQVTSPFLQNLAVCFADFTPREIQVANMIRQGETSKEIASIFNTSIGNVDFHRDNIRKKLGLSHKKSNLRTFLMKLSEK